MKAVNIYPDANTLKYILTNNLWRKNPFRKIFSLLAIFAAFTGAGNSIYGQNNPEMVDPTFNVQVATSSFNLKSVALLTSQSDGKILAVGNFNSYNEQFVGGLVRLNPNGTLDTTFNNGTLKSNAAIGRIIPLANGKIIIVGNNLSLNGQTATLPQIVRLNADGTLDTTFSYTIGGTVKWVKVAANGDLLVDGAFSVVENGAPANKLLIRLTPDGALVPSFNYQGGINQTIAVQNNKVIVVTTEGSQRVVLRFNENGSLDNSFTRKVLTSDIRNIEVQPDGKILIFDNTQKVFRLNENGTDDAGFQTSTYPSQIFDLKLNADGKITLAYGNSSATGLRFVRLLSDGTVDSTFAQFVYYLVPGAFTVQPDGGVVIGDNYIGANLNPFTGFVRLLPSGVQDTAFNADGVAFQNMAAGAVSAIEAQPNGKILLGGNFDKINGVNRKRLARLNADGTIDNSFQINTIGPGNYFSQMIDIFQIVNQPDGKILVSGSFVYVVNGTTKFDIVRLNADGSIDPTFLVSPTIREVYVVNGVGKNKLALLNDGKLVVGTSRPGMMTNGKFPIKYNADGSMDTSFNPTIYSTDNALYIYDLVVQPDGKIIVGGKNSTKGFLVRLNPNGSLDSTFTISEEAGKAFSSVALVENGKILTVKTDATPFNITQSKILRLNANGTVDGSFTAGNGVNGKINALLVLSNGKILIGGKFTTFDNQARLNLGLLSSNGVLETTAYNVNSEVLSLSADGQGRVFVGGTFTTINIDGGQNFVRSYVARLVSAPKPVRFDFDGDGKADLATFAQTGGIWSVRNSQSNQPADAQFGQAGDKTIAADFDGDGKANLAVFRPSNGTWYIARTFNGAAQNFEAIQFGATGDRPVAADFDGDGKADVAVWRPSNGIWYITRKNAAPVYFQFGQAGDVPLSADYDGDGKADIAVFRPSDGTFYWLESGAGYHLRGVQFGVSGDIPAIADYNGDGKDDLVVFRPSNGVWYQYLSTPNGGYTFRAAQFGQAGDEPVAADYDGDGKADIAVRRVGVWHILNSTQGYSGVHFGNPYDEQAIAGLQN